MLSYNLITDDQHDAIDYLYGNDVSYLVASMGFGKSVVTLTAMNELLNGEVLKRILVVAPLRVCTDVWNSEHLNWEHLCHLEIAHAIGSPAKRKAAIEGDAPIVVINIDNFVWFLENYKDVAGFDGLVIDEISKFKDSGTRLVKKLRTHVKKFAWVAGLTGTPVHESFTGLYAQMLSLDGGKSFGRNKQNFLNKFFYPTDYEERNWELKDGMEVDLVKCIAWCLHVTPEYTGELPMLSEVVIGFDLPKDVMAGYKKFAKESVTSCRGVEIVAENAAVLSGKLSQYASGFLYTDEFGASVGVHDTRLLKFIDLIASVRRAIVCYWFKSELRGIEGVMHYEGVRWAHVTDKGAIEAWNAGELDYLLLHPASASHGLNLARGGCDLIFYSMPWSNDIFRQTVARLWRRGQTKAVTSYILCAAGTVDMLKLQRVEDKQEYDALFHAHIATL